MPGRRRSLLAIVLLAAALHTFGIARSILPAQDGLKFIKIARAFQLHPWADVVRGTDQHPLYPALVALAEPVVAAFAGHGPDTWRIAAQLVAALAALALLVPLHGLACRLFGDRVANLTALGFVLLPLPMTVGHDTLSDSLALFAFALALRLGLESLDSERWEPAVGCGVVAGLGFLARPEVLVAALAVVVTGGCRAFGREPRCLFGSRCRGLPGLRSLSWRWSARTLWSRARCRRSSRCDAPRRSGRAQPPVRKAGHWLPKGLDDPHWDFSPKEEPAEVPRRRVGDVLQSLRSSGRTGSAESSRSSRSGGSSATATSGA